MTPLPGAVIWWIESFPAGLSGIRREPRPQNRWGSLIVRPGTLALPEMKRAPAAPFTLATFRWMLKTH